MEASSVLEMNKHILRLRTALLTCDSYTEDRASSATSENREVLHLYQEFLSHSNYSDMADVYLAVVNELEHNESLQREFYEQSFIVVLGHSEERSAEEVRNISVLVHIEQCFRELVKAESGHWA